MLVSHSCARPLLVGDLMTGRLNGIKESFEEDVGKHGGGDEGKKKALQQWEDCTLSSLCR